MATMKMSGCMALVSRMSQSDQDALLARLDQYQADGIPAERAQIMAASDMLAEVDAERTQIFQALAEQFPDLLTEGAVVSTDPGAGDEALAFSRREKPDPKKTVTAYKLFRVDPKKPGQLFPLFVNANDPVDMGVWLDADIGPSAAGGKVKSKLGPLAFRPGWHAGDVPIATHIGGKSSPDLKAPDIRPENQVWAEVEMAADRDWQTEANKRGTNKDGKIVPVKAHITDQVPEDGYYRYKTNANMTGNWLIGGSMKVTRILSDDEVKAINDAAGVADLPRETPFDAEKYGFKASRQRGINVRNDGDNRYADLIVDGEKTMESRNTDSLRPYVGQTVGIIRTGEGKAKLIGSVKIGEPIEVDEQRFRDLEDEHLVPQGSAFDIKPGSTKFLYPLTEAKRFDEERDVDSRGIVAREVQFSRRQTDTPAFKRWFGDSKVVDENGEPRVMYHGTAVSNIGVFKGYRGVAAHFAFDPEFANGFAEQANEAEQERLADGDEDIGDGGQVYAAYLRASNIFDARNPEHLRAAGIEAVEDYATLEGNVRKIKAAGFDSYYDFENSVDDPPTGIAVFSPEQIKSAIGNSGAFDPANPDIRFSRRTPLGFYSALAAGIDGIKTNTAPAQGWKDAIKGLVNKGAVKADEVEWSGINDWLDLQQGKVSKEQVAEYLKAGGVQVEEVVLGGDDAADEAFSNYTPDDAWARANDDGTFTAFLSDEWIGDGYKTEEAAMDAAVEALDSAQETLPTKYAQYTLPGGENYREVLLRLPSKEATTVYEVTADGKSLGQYAEKEVADALAKKRGGEVVPVAAKKAAEAKYKSIHWDQANVIAHIRVNDRTDADGNKVLFVEEIQSDWGQEAKKKGFSRSDDKQRLAELVRKSEELSAERKAVRQEIASLPEGSDRLAELQDRADAILQERGNIAQQITNLNSKGVNAIPPGPFVTKTEGWLNLALKRIVTMAAEGGYDKVAFVNGAQSADRYDLSKQIDYIEYEQTDPGKYYIRATDRRGGRPLTEYQQTPEQLEALVGKEIAQKIVDGKGEKGDDGNTILRTQDLKVGGEGMKTFYDTIVPTAVKKLLPKVGGGQMSTVSLTSRSDEVISRDTRFTFYIEGAAVTLEQPGFDVTDAMRKKVAEGLPLFSRRQRQRESWMFGRDELGRVNFGLGAKGYDIVANVANNTLNLMSMKPVSDELGRAMRNMKVEVERVQNRIAMTAEELAKIPKDEREMISDVIEGELRAGVTPPQRVLQIAASMQTLMSEQSAELVRLGMLSQEAADRWDQKYLPRFYESKLGEEVTAWSKAARALLGRQPMMQGIRGNSLKARGKFETIDVSDLATYQGQGWEIRDPNYDPATSTEVQVWRDYTRQEREDMGEIRDAMFRFVMGYNRSQRDIALGRLYESLAQQYASSAPKDGFVLVPDSKVEGTMAPRYGKLAGKYVPREIMDHLSVNDESMMEGLFKIYRAGLAKWKEGKTVLNPVSHANNVISNLTMAHFAGVSYLDVHKYAGAVRDLVTKDPMVEEAKDIGLFTGTFSQSELVASMPPQLRAMAGMSESKIAKVGEGIWDILAYTVSWNGKKYGARPVMQWAYENEDLFFRYLIYRDARKRGMQPEDAREYSQQFIFTYDDLPKGVRIARDLALPFVSYTYKVIPVMARTLLEYPWRFAAPAGLVYAANAMMYAMAASLGGEDDEWWGKVMYRYVTDAEFRKQVKQLEKGERENLPEWLKGKSALGTEKTIRLGTDDLTGLPLFLDVSKIFPGGDLLDMNNQAGGVALPQPIMPSNPVLTTIEAMLRNRDAFYNKEIANSLTDTTGDKAQKRASWLWDQYTPAIAVGNYHFDRLMNVIANTTGKPITVDAGPLGVIDYTGTDRNGMPVQPKYAAMQTVGIKVRPYDLDKEEKSKESDKRRIISNLDTQIRKIRELEKRGARTGEAADIEVERLREKKRRVQDGLTIEGEEKP